MAGKLDVSGFLPMMQVNYAHSNPAPAATMIFSAPVRLQAKLRRWIEQGRHLLAQGALGRGESPFPASSDMALVFAGERLCASGFTRSCLMQHLVGKGWSKASAHSHVSLTLAFLRHLQLTEEDAGVIKRSSQIQRVQI